MKKILIYISVTVCLFSCIKDAEHRLQNNYPVIETLPVINIDNSGVTFSGSIKQYGKKPIVDHGFVWNKGENPTLNDSYISLGALDDNKYIKTRISYNLLIPNQTYYVKAYMKTNDYVVYGEMVKFSYDLLSTHPVIEIDDTGVTFSGSVKQYGNEQIVDHGFVWGEKENPTLSDSHISLGVLDGDKNIQTRVTNGLKPYETYYVRTFMASNHFVWYADQQKFTSLGSSPPIIERTEPEIITCYESITIYGKNFCNNITDANITLDNGNFAVIESISMDKIVCRFFGKAGPNKIRLSILNKHTVFPIDIKGVEPETIDPSIAKVGSILHVKGKMMDKIYQLFIDEENAKIISASNDEIQVEVPLLDKEYVNRIKIIDQVGVEYYLNVELQIITPWIKKEVPSNFQTSNYDLLFNIGSKIYFQIWDTRLSKFVEFWEIDFLTNQTIQKTMCPENVWGPNDFCFMIGNKAYIYGKEKLLIYDTTTDTWTSGARYPLLLPSAEGRISFSIGNKGYANFIHSGYDCFFYEYDPILDKWAQKGNVQYPNSYFYTSTLQNKAYLYKWKDLWVFDDESGTIVFKRTMDEIQGELESFFAKDNYLYFFTYGSIYDMWNWVGHGYNLYTYNLNNNTITLFHVPHLNARIGVFYFWNAGKIYILPAWDNKFMYILDTSKL